MKRNLIILVVLLGMLVLSGCTTGPVQEPEILPEESEDSVTQIELGPNEFMLASLPDLEPFTPYTEISDRFYEEYTDHLIPRKDYGRLYPFAGKVRTDSNRYTVDVRYGLCDAEGRVVVDPVYSYWNIFFLTSFCNSFYCCLHICVILSSLFICHTYIFKNLWMSNRLPC